MSAPKFTPGPWVATTTPAGKGKVVDSNGFSIANATQTPWTQGITDAYLIAAAPELYEALDSIIHARDHLDEHDRVLFLDDEINAARAALAKAVPHA